MDSILKYLTPINLFIGTIGGVLGCLLGGWDILLKTILLLIVLDYITGILKGIYNKKISSEVGYKGIVKKGMILFVIAMSFSIERLFGNGLPIREMTITLFIVNEAISILENASDCGVPVPKALKDLLIQIKGE